MRPFKNSFIGKTLMMIACFTVVGEFQLTAAIADFGNWTKFEDPEHPNFSASLSGAKVTLSANSGPIPAGTKIGYNSVDGSTAASSGNGSVFNPNADFKIAIDYYYDAWIVDGNLSLGLSIGEETSGVNSVNVEMFTYNFAPNQLEYNSYVNGVSQNTQQVSLQGGGTSDWINGSFIIAYDASSGDITVGAAKTQGASSPDSSFTISGIQNEWTGKDLLASFYLKADGSNGWESGNADAEFSNFRVLEGSPVVVPEPSEIALVTMSFLSFWGIWYRCRCWYKSQSTSDIPTNTQV